MAVLENVAALSWQQTACLLTGIWSIYVVSLVVYRLWFSPLAHIPGPKLAALTQYYEFYYDVVLGGQYTFKIIDMHEQYGPIVRINPWEVHVGDPDFFSELYTGPSRRRDKWTFYNQQSGAPRKKLSSHALTPTDTNNAPESALATIDHSLHKLRRSALNPFFSTQSVRRLQPVIEERVDALLEAFRNYAEVSRGQPLDVMYPFSAFTNDVINEYAFARSDHLVEKSDFGAEVTNNLLIGTHMGPFVKHVNWVLTLVNALPESISSRCMPGWGGFLKMKNDIIEQIRSLESQQNAEKLVLEAGNLNTEMHSTKATREKTPTKLAQEGQILIQGGTLTTSWAMSLATFHLLNRPHTLSKLRDELFEAIPDPNETVPLSKLENLPYLRGVVKEALRLSIGTSSRLARVAPDETVVYYDRENDKEWQLPPGSVVGMSPYKTVMDESIFYDARGFHPERWVEEGEYLEKYMSIFCSVGASLVDMYSKCGCIEEARSLFEELKHKELSAWNSMISGLGAHGLGHDALQLFSIMLQTSSVAPNEITFAGVLCACSHAGLVDEGRKVFDLLSSCYKVVPNVKHYGCMVDLLGRAGLLQEAKEIIEKMPIEPNTVIWKTLLGACRTHKNVELADCISKIATQKGDQDSGFYSLLSNVYKEAGRRDDAGKVRTAMNDSEVCKVAGCSWIEVDGVVHEFFYERSEVSFSGKRDSFHGERVGEIISVGERWNAFGNCYSSRGWMVT